MTSIGQKEKNPRGVEVACAELRPVTGVSTTTGAAQWTTERSSNRRHVSPVGDTTSTGFRRENGAVGISDLPVCRLAGRTSSSLTPPFRAPR